MACAAILNCDHVPVIKGSPQKNLKVEDKQIGLYWFHFGQFRVCPPSIDAGGASSSHAISKPSYLENVGFWGGDPGEGQQASMTAAGVNPAFSSYQGWVSSCFLHAGPACHPPLQALVFSLPPPSVVSCHDFRCCIFFMCHVHP